MLLVSSIELPLKRRLVNSALRELSVAITVSSAFNQYHLTNQLAILDHTNLINDHRSVIQPP